MLNRHLAGDNSWNGNEYKVLFQNHGEAGFSEIGFVSGSGIKEDGRSFVLGDFDGDGDLDIVSNGLDVTAKFLRNEVGQNKHWLKVKLEGHKSNRDGIGARLWLQSGDKHWMRERHLGYSYLSTGQGLWTHFGLGDHHHIDRLKIRWPSGVEDVIENFESNRTILVREGSGQIAATR